MQNLYCRINPYWLYTVANYSPNNRRYSYDAVFYKSKKGWYASDF